MGPGFEAQDFDPGDLTPKLEVYADQDEDGLQGTPDEELPPTPEVGDDYVGAHLLLPRGDDHDMAQGKVVERAQGLDDNPIQSSNDNQIMNTREYIVKIEDGAEA